MEVLRLEIRRAKERFAVAGAGHAVIRDPVGVYIALQAKK